VVPAVPLLRVPFKARSTAVIESALFPVLIADARVKVPVELSSESASMVVAPADVKLLLMLMPSVAFSVIAPGADMPPVVAFKERAPVAETVLLLMTRPLAPVNVRAPCPVMVPPLCPIISFPEELTAVPDATTMLAFARLMSPVP